MKLKPSEIDKIVKQGNYTKINIDQVIRETKLSLKKAILEAQLELLGSSINLTTTKTRFNGVKYWFVCPRCNRRSGNLYFINDLGENVCKKCLELQILQ